MSAAAAEHRVSLASWSMSRSFFAGKWKLLELPAILRNKLGILGLEYVNQFFENPTLQYLGKLKKACADNGVDGYLLMVDLEGATAAIDATERRQAERAHRKWVDAAHYLGCKFVRCNLYGGLEDWKQDKDLVKRGAETMRNLAEYAKGSGVQILVENHGRASSDPDILVSLVKTVAHPDFALLVDLGNWNRGDDRYAAVKKTLPYGRAISVKGTWGAKVEPDFDMEKLVRTALEGGYKGWWGIEQGPWGAEKIAPDEIMSREAQTIGEVKTLIQRVTGAQS
ncbi:MAG: TIM barrel protein [Bryobacteraceae bacterium]|nr:TIM barrel protein [Bryobacteraceae bacterium]